MIKKDPIIEPVSGNNPSDGFDPMYQWACDLFPICRSLTGKGVRETLAYLQKLLPEMIVHSVKSGAQAYDWTIPNEWNIQDAYIEDENGTKIVKFKNHNLHVVGYSEPIDKWMSLEELDKHLYSLPEEPYAIPYITAYYKQTWGFCLTHNQRESLIPGNYHVVIDSSLKKGILNYGELIIKGETDEEFFLSTYVCHPSMANNELSGPVVTASIARSIMLNKDNNKYSYRIVFLPETIGSIYYLSKHLIEMKKNIVSGFVVSCVGDERAYSIIHSRYGKTLSDRVLSYVLKGYDISYKKYSFLERGSDERQYCSPNIDLPVVGFSRSKYATYPEYHTSFDDLSVITQKGLEQSYSVLLDCIKIIEKNHYYMSNVSCEPQLGKRGLYHVISTESTGVSTSKLTADKILDFISYSDGKNDLLEIAKIIDCNINEAILIADKLLTHQLIVDCNTRDK